MTIKPRPQIHLFTDGACAGNPGPGGWAYILRHVRSGKEKEASGSAQLTTNNRMELIAVIRGLDEAAATGAVVFHAGVSRNAAGQIVTHGGRVLGVTARGATLTDAVAKAYRAVDCIHWDGAYCRRDIAAKAFGR